MNTLYYSIIIQWLFIFKGLHSIPIMGEEVRNARPKEFPFIVSLGEVYFSDCGTNHFCGGSLITDRHVLTAAHCLGDFFVDEIQVRINSNQADHGRKVMLSAMITFDEWAMTRHMAKHPGDDFDVAILTLDKSVKDLNIPLPIISDKEDTEYYGKEVMTAGWGTYGPVKNDYFKPIDLKAVTMTLWDPESCIERIRALRKNPEILLPIQWICTTSPKTVVLGGGDSGGPLLYNKNVIIGVNSGATPKKSEYDTNVQNVYISTHYLKEFIDDITKK